MNYKISEKIVTYRIQNGNDYVIKEPIGAVIKNERISQGLNQDYVCKDICSVSYYSRIENNKINPTYDYIDKIFAKLKKPVPETLSVKCVKNEIIEEFLTAIEYRNDKLIDQEFEKLKNIPNINIELYEFVYYIYKRNFDNIEKIIQKLHSQQVYFTNYELIIYLNNLGGYYIVTNKYNLAEKYLSYAVNLQKYAGVIEPSVLYRYAWVLGKLQKPVKCIEYAQEAESIYNKYNNIYRSVQCQLLIAINYSNKFPEHAIRIYERISKVTLHLNMLDLNRIINFNLALNYKKYNYLEKSEKLFLDLIQNYDVSFIFEVYAEYVDLLEETGRIEEAKEYHNQLKDVKFNTELTSFYITYYDYKLYYHSIEERIEAYKNIFIPYCIKTGNIHLEFRCRNELCNLYERNNNYSECINEYKNIMGNINHYQEIFNF